MQTRIQLTQIFGCPGSHRRCSAQEEDRKAFFGSAFRQSGHKIRPGYASLQGHAQKTSAPNERHAIGCGQVSFLQNQAQFRVVDRLDHKIGIHRGYLIAFMGSPAGNYKRFQPVKGFGKIQVVDGNAQDYYQFTHGF